MKKIFLVILMVFSTSMKAQTINDIFIKDLNVSYIQIVGTSKFMSNKVTIELDFGQHNKLFSNGKNMVIMDENKKPINFNSMIDALNFLSLNGFRLVQTYAFSTGNSNVYHFVLEKVK